MGHGIAELCAISGYNVVLADVNEDILGVAMGKIKESIARIRASGKIQEEPDFVLSRIKTTTDLGDLSDSGYILEAVKEKIEVKRQVLRKLSGIAKPDCIFFSNTSTIPITELASMTDRPELFAGLHFFNPPVLMPLVEIIRGEKTSDETVNRAIEIVQSLKKEYLLVQKDIPGFVVNRLNERLFSEALELLSEDVSPIDLDAAVKYRLNFPMGIFELMDFIGLDVVLGAKTEMVKHGFDAAQYEILKSKVDSNELGIKTGKGFYNYGKMAEHEKLLISPSDKMYRISFARLFSGTANECSWLIRNGVAYAEDIERAMKMSMNWPSGPIELSDRIGLDKIIGNLNALRLSTGRKHYSPDAYLLDLQREGSTGIESGKGFLSWPTESCELGPVIYSVTDSYAVLTINRPGKLNSLSEDVWLNLRLGLEKALHESRARSVIITGKGRAFSSGDDIRMMDSWKTADDSKKWMDTYALPLIELLFRYQKPIISAVNGIAYGGGAELNLLFDIVVSSERALFSFSESLIGAIPPIASSLGVSALGRKLTPYLLTGDPFSASKAKELGIVDVVTENEMAMDVAVEFATRISRASPASVSSIKSIGNVVKSRVIPEARAALDELLILSATEEFKEGQAAFIEKRKPVWKHKPD